MNFKYIREEDRIEPEPKQDWVRELIMAQVAEADQSWPEVYVVIRFES